INTKIIISSNIDINHTLKSQEKVIAISKKLNTKEYINPIGGKELYDIDTFKKEKIKLSFLESNVPKYKQFNTEFISYLSIIDIMMFNNKDQIKEMLNDFTLITKECT
ncbi:MAG: WbqC family protein, partial [Campylobacteraceae bacterium]|nr:WbqC family protein [Campylobacteraceae bacterium]